MIDHKCGALLGPALAGTGYFVTALPDCAVVAVPVQLASENKLHKLRFLFKFRYMDDSYSSFEEP